MLPIPANIKIVVLVLLTGALASVNLLVKLDPSVAWLPGLAQALVLIEGFFTLPQSAQDKMRALAKGPIAVLLLVGIFAATQTACVSSAPIVPVTPANQAQVSSCQTDATEHNGFVLGGITVGATATGMGGIAAAIQGNPGAQQALAVGAAVAGGLAAIAAGGAGLTASAFANGQCTSVVGALPAKPASQARLLPRLSEIDETTVTVERVSR